MKRNVQPHKQRYFALSALSVSLMILSQSIYALQVLDDHDLRTVNGQDGLSIHTTYGNAAGTTGIDIKELYWEDKTGNPSTIVGQQTLRASANNVQIRDSNINDGIPLGTKYEINVGGEGSSTGIDLNIQTNHSLITVDSFTICSNLGCTANDKSLGKLGIHSTTPIDLHFKTTDGLFSKDGMAEMSLGLKNTNIYLGQTQTGISGLNQLVLKNFNFNFNAKGKMYVDPVKGLYLETGSQGYVDFNRVVDSGAFSASGVTLGSYPVLGKPSNAGVNLELMLKSNTAVDNLYGLDSNNNPAGATGLIRVGASGRMVNGFLQLRGIKTDETVNDNILGLANSSSVNTNLKNTVIGDTGIGFRMRGEFTNTNDGSGGDPTKLEIGGAGLNTYGFEFGNLSALQSGSTNRAYFDSGNIYVNLVDTKTLTLPTNYTFQNSRFGGLNNEKLTSNADYQQDIHKFTGANPYSIVMAIRGAEFQAVSRQGRFTNSATDGSIVVPQITGANAGVNNSWGLALPFYNMNANIGMYGTEVAADNAYYFTVENDPTTELKFQSKRNVVASAGTTQRLGFSLAMSTEGIDKTAAGVNIGNKTTSILVIDGANNPRVNKPTDYYMGIRNIDMLLKGAGSVGLENGSFNMSLKDMLIVMAGEIAAGYLPGADYRTCPAGASNCTAPLDNFARSEDVLMGVKLRLGGEMNLSLIPNSQYKSNGLGNRLSIVGDLKLDANSKNTIQISDPADGSILGLDNISGSLQFNNAIVIAPNSMGEGMVGFNTGLRINPEGLKENVLRIKDVNFYPATGTAQRLGEMVFTGGTLNSRFNIVPR